MILRDLRLIYLELYPIRVIPKTGEIKVISKITLQLFYEEYGGENIKYREAGLITPELENLYRYCVVNYDYLNLNNSKSGRFQPDLTYLIITYDDFIEEVQPLAEWYTRAVYLTDVVALNSIGNSYDNIKSYIQTQNNEHNLQYVLLVGDISLLDIGSYSGAPSDHQYTLLEGNDDLPDIALGRLSCTTESDVTHQIQKFINYTFNPPIDNWVQKSILCAHE